MNNDENKTMNLLIHAIEQLIREVEGFTPKETAGIVMGKAMIQAMTEWRMGKLNETKTT